MHFFPHRRFAMSSSADDVLQAIRRHLAGLGCGFRQVHHPPTRTSEESAAARGEPLHIGGKALLLKGEDDVFRLFVLPADARLDSQAIRQELGLRKARFASPEELLEQTGLVPGSVPPFGRPILPFDLYVDRGIVDNDRIAFNAGSLTDSIILSTEDYLRAAKPQGVFDFGKPP
jgi:prolyl-tRNA editing enzyme YbaK/EbsC (Cys-tRNA(Pro) deacylase)